MIPAAKKKSLTRYWPWLIVALFVIWLFDTAPADKHASRVAAAVALSAKCEIAQARSELAKLKTGKATPEQIKRASQAIERSAPACEKAQQREKAWSETKTAVDSSLQAGTHAKAVSALAAFTRRWGTDAKTQELKNMIELKQTGALVDMAEVCLGQGDRVCAEQRLSGAERRKQPELSGRIDQLREQLRRLIETPTGAKPALPATVTLEPKAAPTAQPVQPPIAPTASNQATALPSQSARNMVNNAERDLAHGNYKGAADKMEICMTIIDPGNQDCQQLKQKADRLNRKMMECVASGAEWINERCQ